MTELESISTQLQEQIDLDPSFRGLKAKVITLAIAIGMLPVLVVGTAIYHFGTAAIDEQIVEAQRSGLARDTTLIRQREQLATLLLGTGATALLSGLIAAAWANRTLASTVKTAAAVKSDTVRQADAQEAQQLTKAIHNIRSALVAEDILKVAVEEARKVIGCDRVAIYMLEREGVGTIVAESVDSMWPKAFRARINDPCFAAKYTEAYRRGRVKATNDIYTEYSACYIEELEKFAVKANLVTPILNGDRLFGLLIAHQCSGTRNWKTSEIEAFSQLAGQVGIALDGAKFQQYIAAEASISRIFGQTISRIRDTASKQDVLKETVEAGRSMISADRVVILEMNEDSTGTVVAESIASGFPKTLKAVFNDPCLGAKYIEAYRTGRVKATGDIYTELSPCYIGLLEPYAIRAVLVTPIVVGENLYGLLIAHQCSNPRDWQEFEIQWFSQLATQAGFALRNADLLTDKANLQKQAEREIEWKEYLADATAQIHASLSREDIFKTSVEEIRRVLACDRVLIYSVDRQSMGIIIAESVAEGWVKALGRKIEDPCFEARYVQKYENGRVRALDNIYESGMTQCYIDQLEVLQVKANLVAPVLHEGKLLGLLVAHQCATPRHWKPLEIGWFKQIAVQIGYALDNSKLVGRINELSQDAELQQHSSALLRNLSNDAHRQVETTAAALWQIQSVSEQAQDILSTVHQTELQVQQADQTIQTGQELIGSTVESIIAVQQTLTDVVERLKQLSLSSLRISDSLTLINDLATQMNQEVFQSAIALGRAGDGHQVSVLSAAETVRSLNVQLATTIEATEHLVAEIAAESKSVISEMESGVQQGKAGTKMAKEARGKLMAISEANDKISQLVSKVAQTAANQVQSSTAANHIAVEIAEFAKYTSEQSIAVVNSFLATQAGVSMEPALSDRSTSPRDRSLKDA